MCAIRAEPNIIFSPSFRLIAPFKFKDLPIASIHFASWFLFEFVTLPCWLFDQEGFRRWFLLCRRFYICKFPSFDETLRDSGAVHVQSHVFKLCSMDSLPLHPLQNPPTSFRFCWPVVPAMRLEARKGDELKKKPAGQVDWTDWEVFEFERVKKDKTKAGKTYLLAPSGTLKSIKNNNIQKMHVPQIHGCVFL